MDLFFITLLKQSAMDKKNLIRTVIAADSAIDREQNLALLLVFIAGGWSHRQ